MIIDQNIEKYDHPEWMGFDKYFTKLLTTRGSSCWERDVLRQSKDHMWYQWLARVDAKVDG